MSSFKDKPLKKCHTDKRKMIDDLHSDIIEDNQREIDYLDRNNMSSVGFSIISNQRKHLVEKEQAIMQFIELKLLGRGEIINVIYDENKI